MEELDKRMSDQEQKIMSDYKALMSELKLRVKLIRSLLNDPQPHPQGFVKEFCYLQIRMVCELIALGCLIAHSGIKGAQTGYLKKAYAADRIVDELEKLHPHFFPLAFVPIVGDDGLLTGITQAPDGYLTKDELIRLNGLCGDALHRGNIQRFLSKEQPASTNRAATVAWVDKLVSLLEHHSIVLEGMDKVIACRLGITTGFPMAIFFMVAIEDS